MRVALLGVILIASKLLGGRGTLGGSLGMMGNGEVNASP